MNLPTYEIDHYELDDGEELNREYPDTYWIPEKSVRESLETGTTVKLVFRMEEHKGSDAVSVERMWVKITKIRQGLYEGILDNDPGGSNCVMSGQVVYFQSCHVIDVHGE